LRLPDSVPPGGAIRCPKCKAALRLPGKAPAPATPKTAAPQIRTAPAPKTAAKQPPAPPPRAIKPAAAKATRAKPRDDEVLEVDDDDVKAPRSVKSKSNKGLLIGILAGVAMLFLVCGGGAIYGVVKLFKRGADQVQQTLNEMIKQAEKKRLDVSFIHADCNAAFVIQPARMAQSKLLTPEEREKIVAKGIQEADINVTKLEQVIFVLEPAAPGQAVKRPQPPRQKAPRPRPGMKPGQPQAQAINEPAPVTFAMIMRFNEPVDGKKLLDKALHEADPMQVGDKTYLRSKLEKTEGEPLAGYFDGQRVVLIGPQPMIAKMLVAKDVHSQLTEKLREFELDNDIFGVTLMAPFKPMLKGLTQAPNIPPQLEQAKKLDQTLSAVKVLVNLDGDKPLQIILLGEDDASGPSLEDLARNALEMGKAFYPFIKMSIQQAAQKDAPPQAIEKFFKVTDQIMQKDGITVTREGKDVTVALNRPKDL
jgi:hypothetical protein